MAGDEVVYLGPVAGCLAHTVAPVAASSARILPSLVVRNNKSLTPS